MDCRRIAELTPAPYLPTAGSPFPQGNTRISGQTVVEVHPQECAAREVVVSDGGERIGIQTVTGRLSRRKPSRSARHESDLLAEQVGSQVHGPIAIPLFARRAIVSLNVVLPEARYWTSSSSGALGASNYELTNQDHSSMRGVETRRSRSSRARNRVRPIRGGAAVMPQLQRNIPSIPSLYKSINRSAGSKGTSDTPNFDIYFAGRSSSRVTL